MKNSTNLLVLLLVSSLTLIGCASTDKDGSHNESWQGEDEGKKKKHKHKEECDKHEEHSEHEEHMEREIYRDK